jgi:hypothetical protein
MVRRIISLVLFSYLAINASVAQSQQQSINTVGSTSGPSISSGLPAGVKQGEVWTNLLVDRKVLKPQVAGSVLGKEEKPGFTKEFLRFEWRMGDPIDIVLIKPRSVVKPRVVLYLYSYPGDIDRFRDDGWAERATSTGMAAVGFVSALTGERYHSRPMKQWFISELQESLVKSTHDVQLIVDYLEARSDLNTDKIGMFGQGSGATIAILAASVDKRITTLDLLNPWGDWPDWLRYSAWVPENERPNYITPEFLQKAAVGEPVTCLPMLKDREVRLQQIMDDGETPEQARDKIAAAAPSGDLVQYKNKDAHRTAWLKTGLTGWLADHLGANPAPVTVGSTKQ